MDRPNILIFMTDQQRADTVPPYGRALTPHLDAFAKEAVAFTQAYCPSPHCSPSRATFFTGLYPTQHGVWNNVGVGNALSRGLNEGIRLWSEDLTEAGYELTFHGKWHVSSLETPEDRGWNTASYPGPHPSGASPAQGAAKAPDPPQTGPAAPALKQAPRPHLRDWNRYLNMDPHDSAGPRREGEIQRPGYGTYTHYGAKENPFNDRNVVDQAIDAIRSRGKSDAPWCHYIGTLGPHDPYFVPKRFLDMYDPDSIELPANFHDRMRDKPALYRRMRDRFDQLTEREHKEAIRHYLAFCTYEDALFGEVLAALEETGDIENTVVIYLSDHGDYVAEHGLWTKGLPCFRSAYHIPALVRWPQGVRRPGRQVDAFVSLADFGPTFLELAGVRTDRPFAGRSLVPFLRDETGVPWRDAVYTQSNGNELYGIQRSVMTRKWKYVYNGFDYDELYDLENDPGETRNLIDRPEHRETVRALAKKMWRFAYDHEDVCVNGYIAVALAPYGPGIAFEPD